MKKLLSPILALLSLAIISCDEQEIPIVNSQVITIQNTLPQPGSKWYDYLSISQYQLINIDADGRETILESSLSLTEDYEFELEKAGESGFWFRHNNEPSLISPMYYFTDSISSAQRLLKPTNKNWALVEVLVEDQAVTSVKIDGLDLYEAGDTLFALVKAGQVNQLEVYKEEELNAFDLSELAVGDSIFFQIREEVNTQFLEFENDLFLQSILSQVDSNGDGGITEEEAYATTTLSLEGVELNTLKDLIYFPALQELTIKGAVLTSIDLSQNTALTFLDLTDNELESIDVSPLTQLVKLYLEDNYISTIDMSALTNIEEVVLADNSFEETFTLAGLNSLEYIDLSENLITGVDFSNLSQLQNLLLNETDILELDLTNFSQITYLMLNYTPLTSLDVSMLTSLNYFECANSSLTCIQVSEARFNNPPTTWVLPANARLSTNCSTDNVDAIEFDNDNLKAFLVSRFDENDDGEISSQEAAIPTLLVNRTTGLSGSYQGLEYFVNLRELDLPNSTLYGIDLSTLTKLEILYLRVGDAELDMTQNTALKEIDIRLEQETTISVAASNSIDRVILKSYRETAGYDLSAFTNATYIEVYGWEMKNVNLSGLNNVEVLDIESTNPNGAPTVSDFVADFSDLNKLRTLKLIRMRMEEIKGLDQLTQLETFLTYGATFGSVDFSNNTLLGSLDLRSKFSELRFGANLQNLNEISYFPFDDVPTIIYIPENPNLTEINLSSVQYAELGEMVGLEELTIYGYYDYDAEQEIFTNLELDLSTSAFLTNLTIEDLGVSNVILPSENSSLEIFNLTISNSQTFPFENFEDQKNLELIDFSFDLSSFTLPAGFDKLTNIEFSYSRELKNLNLASANALSSLRLSVVPKLECLKLPSGFNYTPPNGADYTSGCN